MDLPELLQQKRETIKAVCARYGADNVRVFGSVARGDFGKASDIDFLIRLDTSRLEGMRYFGILEELREELAGVLGCKVDLVEEKGLRENIRDEVLSEAIAL